MRASAAATRAAHERALTLGQVAERASLDLSTLSRLEAGKRRLALDHVLALAAAAEGTPMSTTRPARRRAEDAMSTTRPARRGHPTPEEVRPAATPRKGEPSDTRGLPQRPRQDSNL